MLHRKCHFTAPFIVQRAGTIIALKTDEQSTKCHSDTNKTLRCSNRFNLFCSDLISQVYPLIYIATERACEVLIKVSDDVQYQDNNHSM